MDKFKGLSQYQKVILIFTAVMVVVFTVLYPITMLRTGFLYRDTVLTQSFENGNTIYSGKVDWKQAVFTVYEDKTVLFEHGDKTYGPYTAKEDQTAIPQDNMSGGGFVGIELRDENEIVFRGGVVDIGNDLFLVAENENFDAISITFESNGVETDIDGNVIDDMAPSVSDILSLMFEPELQNKGDLASWFLGVFICILIVLNIWFQDELFRWRLSFQIQDVDKIEPTDWEITSRVISSAALTILALVTFIIGLQIV